MKTLKKLTTLLALVLTFNLFVPEILPTQNNIMEVNAATVKLNKKTATLVKGKTLTLKVIGTKKKVTWKSSNSKVAAVSSKGKVTAKKKGTATITAKVGKKKLTCKITVKNKSKNSGKIQGISYNLQDTGNGVVAILKNNNKYHVSMTAKIAYYRNGKMIRTVSNSNSAFEKGKICALFFHAPYDSHYNHVDYDDYKISISAEKETNLICASSKIKVTSNFGADNVSAKIKNNSGKKLSYILISCVFYDSKGNAIGYDYHYAECTKKGSTDYLSFSFPHDKNYNTIRPKKYKIYVNEAYTYTWMN